MENGKEKKTKEKPNRDPSVLRLDPNEFFNNTLSLPQSLKEYLKGEELDWRFLNAGEFRSRSNSHRSNWRVFVVPDSMRTELGATAEGTIQRGDVILGVREKQVSAVHRKIIADRTRRQSGANKQSANELRNMAKQAGVSGQTKIHEGYEDNE